MWQDEWRARGIPEDEWPIVNLSTTWRVRVLHRRTACENRPGLKMMRVRVLDAAGEPLRGVYIGLDTEPSEGVAYDHQDVYGLTNERGYLEWNSLGIPTRYMLWIAEMGVPLIERIRTDLKNEYCRPGPWWRPGGWNPVNRPGIYSYDIELERR